MITDVVLKSVTCDICDRELQTTVTSHSLETSFKTLFDNITQIREALQKEGWFYRSSHGGNVERIICKGCNE